MVIVYTETPDLINLRNGEILLCFSSPTGDCLAGFIPRTSGGFYFGEILSSDLYRTCLLIIHHTWITGVSVKWL